MRTQTATGSAQQPELCESFECFGSTCSLVVAGAGAGHALADAKRRLLGWQAQFSRFDPASELSRLNADPRESVPVTTTMARLVGAIASVGSLSGGLVDATLVAEIEQAGYAGALRVGALPLALALALAPSRRPAGPSPRRDWQRLGLDPDGPTLKRPVGVRLDSGGIAKGLFADLIAEDLGGYDAYAVDCGGDVRFGGRERRAREVHVGDPFDGSVLHSFQLTAAAVATSGIGRRSWIDEAGRPAHHLIDPASGRPAFTGIVQASAFAPTGVLAEAHAKAAILAGPKDAAGWLPWGGVIVFDDRSSLVVAPNRLARRDSDDSQPQRSLGEGRLARLAR